MSEDSAEWHARFGAESFNSAWEFIDKADRSEQDSVEMLAAAAASRWHKSFLGRPDLLWMGEWQLAHVASLIGLTELALTCARRSLDIAEAEGWTGWRLASAHEGMARASAAAGDKAARAHHVEAANAALAIEPEEEERAVIAGQLASIPEL